MTVHRRVQSGTGFEAQYGYSRAVRVGDRVWVAGTAPVPPPNQPIAANAYDQMMRCGEIVYAALEQVGATPSDVVRTRMFITDPADSDAVGRAHGALFGSSEPASTMVVVAALLHPAWMVEIEVEAVVTDQGG